MQKMKYLEGLTKHYTFIDTPKPVRLVANPFKTSQGWSGTDSAFLPAGAWRIDNWTLLLTKDFPNSPAFKLALVWDDEQLDIDKVTIEFHDVNFGEGVAGVAGQAVVVNGFSGAGLGNIENIITKIGDINTLLGDSKNILNDSRGLLERISENSSDIAHKFGGVLCCFDRLLRPFSRGTTYVCESSFHGNFMKNGDGSFHVFPPKSLVILDTGISFNYDGIDKDGGLVNSQVNISEIQHAHGVLRAYPL